MKIQKEIGFKVENGKRTETIYEEIEDKSIKLSVVEDLEKDFPFIYDKREKELLKIGAEWQAERYKKMYSEEDMREAFESGTINQLNFTNGKPYQNSEEWFEQFKKK